MSLLHCSLTRRDERVEGNDISGPRDEILGPLAGVMQSDSGSWHFDEKSSDRLWHKSAIGIPVQGGGISLTSVEMMFCINHRNIESPAIGFLLGGLERDPALFYEYAVMEALRTPGNKIVLRCNLGKLGIGHSKRSWGLRWESDKHPSKDPAVSEVRWFTAEQEFDVDDLYEWVREVEDSGRIAESIVVDEEMSVVTYRLSIADPRGNLTPPSIEEFLIISDNEYAETMTGGAYFPGAEDWPLEAVGIPVQGGRQLDWAERELVHFFGKPSKNINIEDFSTGPTNPHLGMTKTASLLHELWNRGLNTRSGFKFGTTWRCYSGSVGQDHAPWLINDPEDCQKTIGVWAKACLTSRLASGVNKHWICPVDVGTGEWRFLRVSRPPADSRWSNPR